MIQEIKIQDWYPGYDRENYGKTKGPRKIAPRREIGTYRHKINFLSENEGESIEGAGAKQQQ